MKKTINYTIGNLSPKDLELFKTLFNYDEVRSASSAKSDGTVIESNYIRVYEFRYWDTDEVNTYNNKIKQFNDKAESCTLEITNYDDYEVEWDNDRSWPASFILETRPKK